MIDWERIDTDATDAWVGLAERIIEKSQTLLTVQSPDAEALRAAQQDLADFVDKANLACPRAAIIAVRRASEQISQALAAITLDDLESRTRQFDVIKARMTSAASELRAEAAMLKLVPVREALGKATEVAARMRSLALEVRSLRKDEIPDKITDFARQLDQIVELMRVSSESP